MRVAPLLLVLLLLAVAAPSARAQASGTFTLNIVRANDIDCSPDVFTQPDLRITVYVDGAQVLQTVKAQDERKPLYGDTAIVAASAGPTQIEVTIEEAEPSGLFGTSWVECDAAPGAATRHRFEWNGEAALVVVAKGDGDRSAEAVLVVGTTPPAPVRLTGVVTGPYTIDVTWEGDSTGRATSHQLGRAGASPPSAINLPAGPARAQILATCDNWEYGLRVVRDAAPWHVTSPTLSLRTTNAAPPEPVVIGAPREGDVVNVRWETRAPHDIARFDVHAGVSADFEPSEASKRGELDPVATFTGEFATDVQIEAGDAFVKVVHIDTGALSSTSGALAIDGPTRAAGPPPDVCTWSVGTVSALGDGPRETPVAQPPVATTPTQAPPQPTTAAPPTTTSPATTTPTTPPPPSDPGLPPWAMYILIAVAGLVVGIVAMLALRRP